MTSYPYIPNSDPEIKKQMLDYIGVRNVDELFAEIPENVRYNKRLDLPKPTSEYDVRRLVEELLSRLLANSAVISETSYGGENYTNSKPITSSESRGLRKS